MPGPRCDLLFPWDIVFLGRPLVTPTDLLSLSIYQRIRSIIYSFIFKVVENFATRFQSPLTTILDRHCQTSEDETSLVDGRSRLLRAAREGGPGTTSVSVGSNEHTGQE
jgi:hypothetical protein